MLFNAIYKNVVNSQIMGLQNKNGSGLFFLETAAAQRHDRL
jgi:hypothetical protein